MNRSRTRGFTLIELLVAIAIFAAIATIAYGSVNALIRARDRIDAGDARLRAMQNALTLFERDVRSAVARPVREAYGDARGALVGQRDSVSLTRLRSGGLADASPQTQRVEWSLTQGRWTRVTWRVADIAPSSEPRRQRVLDDVRGVSLRYLDAQGQWREVWPAADAAIVRDLTRLPRALDLRIQLADVGELRRVLELPDAAAAELSVPGEAPAP